jgi:hypothetical protein
VEKITTSWMTSSRSRNRTITTLGILLLIRTSTKLEQLSQALDQPQGRSWFLIPKSSGAVYWLPTAEHQTQASDHHTLIVRKQFRRNPETLGSRFICNRIRISDPGSEGRRRLGRRAPLQELAFAGFWNFDLVTGDELIVGQSCFASRRQVHFSWTVASLCPEHS